MDPTGLSADPASGWQPVSVCPHNHNLSSLLEDARVQHHLCRAGAAFGTCDALEMMGNCSSVRVGRFARPARRRRPLRCGVDTCCPPWRDGVSWVNGLRWDSKEAVSPPGCLAGLKMRWLGRAEIEQCLRGKLLVFQGDSLTRQLFNRLIWWVRGIPSVVEQYYQTDAYYAFSEEEGDEFFTRRDPATISSELKHQSSWGLIDAAVHGNATLDTGRGHLLYQSFRNSRFGIDDVIAGSRFMSAGGVRNFCRRQDPTHGCSVNEHAGGGAPGVPWDATRLLGLVQGNMGQLAIHRARPAASGGGWDRAHFSVRVLAETAPLLLERNVICVNTKHNGTNSGMIDLSALLETVKIAHGDALQLPTLCSHEDGHFQCSFNSYNERASFFKRPLSGDCRDLASLNTVQLILSSLCGQYT